ncbi:MAG: VRR-NUC domain-containing protein [Porphyromonadaceae bacterium]|nr:VRR-NUC domain-containing protein [Porphyromonadaceae bacterium]
MTADEYRQLVAEHNAPKRRAKKPRHKESELQKACVAWFRVRYPKSAKMLFSVPNGGKRNVFEATIMKSEGVVAGVADLLLLIPRKGFGCLCIEMKAGKGRQSDLQKEWEALTTLHGNKYVVVRSREEFEGVVEEYLSG